MNKSRQKLIKRFGATLLIVECSDGLVHVRSYFNKEYCDACLERMKGKKANISADCENYLSVTSEVPILDPREITCLGCLSSYLRNQND